MEQFFGDDSVNVAEILCGNVAAVSGRNVGSEGNVGTDEVDKGSQVRTTSMCRGLTTSANLEGSDCEASSHERDEMDRLLREELGGSRVPSTPVMGLWPIYSRRRSFVLGGHKAPPR